MKLLVLFLTFLPVLVFAKKPTPKKAEGANLQNASKYSNEIYNFRKTDQIEGWKKAIACYKAAREARTSFGVDTGEIFESKTQPPYFYSVYDYAPLGFLSYQKDGKPEKASPPTLFVFNEQGASAYLLKPCDDGTFHCARSYSVIPPGSEPVGETGSETGSNPALKTSSGRLVCLKINHKLLSAAGDTDPQKRSSDFKTIPDCSQGSAPAFAKVDSAHSKKIPQESYNMIYWRIVDQVKQIRTELSQKLPLQAKFGAGGGELDAKQKKLTASMIASCKNLQPASDPTLFSDNLRDVLTETESKYLASIGKKPTSSGGSDGAAAGGGNGPQPAEKRGQN